MRIWRLVSACSAVLAVTALAAGGLVAGQPAAAAAVSCQPRPAQPRDPGPFGNVFIGVAVTSACNAWAVGGYTDGHVHDPLIERWDGTRWSVQANTRSGTLTAVAALSSGYAWAVGGAFHRALIEQWNGSRWRVVRGGYTRWGAELTGVAVVSRSDAWAVGYNRIPGGGTQTLIEHWDGASWRRVASRDVSAAVFNELTSVTAAGPDNVWAVGWANTIARFVPLIEHWNGRSWSRVRVGNARGSSQLLAVSAASARDVWAVGIGDSAQGIQETLTEHWNGATWQREPSPSPGYPGHARLNAVSTISPTRAWAVGWFLNAGGGIQTLTERWNGSSWQETPSPNPGSRATVNEFAAIGTSPGGLTWAVGNYLPLSGRPAIRALAARVR